MGYTECSLHMYRDPLIGFKDILKLILFFLFFFGEMGFFEDFFNYYYTIEKSDFLIM